MCIKNYDQMMYSSWDMVHDRCNCYFSFWAIFCPFTPLTAQTIKILKKWKKTLEISSFYICVPKNKIRWFTVSEICCTTDGRTNRWTDRQTKWHMEVGAYLNITHNKWHEVQYIIKLIISVRFDTNLLQMNLKFVLGSLSSILGMLVNCFCNFVE